MSGRAFCFKPSCTRLGGDSIDEKAKRSVCNMKSKDIQQTFLEFFDQRGHVTLPGSPLVPANDPTLLFTNAGMVPFKDTFLGIEQRPYSRACTIQKCLR